MDNISLDSVLELADTPVSQQSRWLVKRGSRWPLPLRYFDPATQAWRTVQEPMPQTRTEQAEYVNRVQTQAFNAAGAR